jgi:predicted metal-dependent phosphoesterase TrpH
MEGISLYKVELHCHSTASDGSLTPKELVNLAYKSRIKHLSLTDHDTVAGLKEAGEEAKRLGINFINGIEVTADTSFLGEGKRQLHILGYHFEPESRPMRELTDFFQKSRVKRNKELLARLEELGYPLTYEEMAKKHGENFGKPNIAKRLIELGYFKDREEAIDFLSSLGVKREKMNYQEVFKLIREAGGFPVIAHPITTKLGLNELYCFLKRAKEEGLEGVETLHYRHTAPYARELFKMCDRLSLYTTAGSDFHGDNKPCIKLGFLNTDERDVRFPL